jgi:cholinesterase
MLSKPEKDNLSKWFVITYASDIALHLLTIEQPVLVGNNDNEAGGGALSFTGGKSDPAAVGKQNAGFACPPARAAEARVNAGLPTWRYRYMAAYPNTGVMPGPGKPLASHGAELTIVWGTMDNLNRSKSTPEELALSKNIRTAWSTFAKNPKEGLTKLGWPIYDPSRPTLVVLGANNKPEITFANPNVYDGACDDYWKSNSTTGPPKMGLPPFAAAGGNGGMPKGPIAT